MRPGQNKRMRGRNPGGGRKGPNPLTRSYESNGPDVKIRGTAQHVAEKYLQLARDAQSSGDPVMAESYLQHAEHYFRIIAAAHQAQQQAQMGHMRPPGEAVEVDEVEDDGDLGMSDRFASVADRLPPQPVYQAQNFQPQPNFGGGQPQQPYGERPRFNDRPDRQNFGDRPNYNGGERNERWRNDRQPQERQDRPDRPYQERPYQDRPYQDRNERPNFQGPPYQDRGNRGDQRRFRGDRPDRPERPEGQSEPAGELPAFITGGGARPVGEAEAQQPEGGEAPREFGGESGGFHLRSRRRRGRGRPDGDRSPNDVPDADEVPAGE